MPIQVKKFNLDEVKREFLASSQWEQAMRQLAEDAFHDLKAIIEKVYAPTLSIGGGADEYTNAARAVLDQLGSPQLYIELDTSQIKIGNDQLSFSVQTSVQRASGGALHNLWYWLDRGTRDLIWAGEPTPAFKTRNPRTRPGALTVGPYVDTGEYAAIRPGGRRRGIEAREWSQQIGQEVQQIAESSMLAGHFDWRVRFVVEDAALDEDL